MIYRKLLYTIYFGLVTFFLNSCVPLDQQGYQTNGRGGTTPAATSGNQNSAPAKMLIPDDRNYEAGIRTALLYPGAGNKNDATIPPIIPLQQSIPLILEFDEMGNNMQTYYMKIINCYANWNPSPLNQVQYLNQVNEFLITDRKTSYNTLVPYIHYKIAVPPVKQSGNYLVVVYRDRNESDIVLTRRFIVYEKLINIGAQTKFSVVTRDRETHQQIDFVITYPNYPLINPVQSLNIVLRQNHRFDNAIKNLKPSFIQESVTQLDYLFYEGQNTFKASNEFRNFDGRSNRFRGFNVGKVDLQPNKTELYLAEDKSRRGEPYAYFEDIDGKFVPERYETGDRETEPDYVYVNFALNVPKEAGKIFVMGSFNDWRADKNVEMTYNEEQKRYTGRILMKQGYYNYRYGYLAPGTQTVDETYFEGSHSMTQNVYDLIAYYRPFGKLTDNIVGYTTVNYNGRIR